MNRELAQYIMSLDKNGGRPAPFNQQPQTGGFNPVMLAELLKRFGGGIIGNPERGTFQIPRPQGLPNGAMKSPFFKTPVISGLMARYEKL